MHLDNTKVDTNAPRRYNFAKKYCGRYIIETNDENLRLVFLLITQKQLMIWSKVKLEVKTIGQEL